MKDSAADEYSIGLERLPVPALVLDSELTVRGSNASAAKLLHVPILAGRKLGDLAAGLEQIEERFGEDRTAAHGFELEVTIDNTSAFLDVFIERTEAGEVVLLLADVTERRREERSSVAAERQKLKLQRTEALERLAGGIAHEFNNILASVLLQADMMDLQLDEGSPMRSRVHDIKEAANDAASIVRQLLAFGRRQSMNPAPASLNSIIDIALRDLRALLGDKITLSTELHPELGLCFVDQGQIAQALMYLALNAKDSIADSGSVTVRTRNIESDDQLIHATQTSGHYVEISVTDTRPRMDARIADHIFEPFFSKKGARRTTGLGLATVYGIVKQSGGFVWVRSIEDVGTTFSMQFPRIDEPRSINTDPGRVSRTVLLIDDEPLVRRVAAEGLRNAGLRVLEAASGAEAVEMARTIREKVDLVLADLSMPGMDGDKAAVAVKEFHPNAQILLMSGDASTVKGHRFLSKPFTLNQLVNAVSAAIAAEG